MKFTELRLQKKGYNYLVGPEISDVLTLDIFGESSQCTSVQAVSELLRETSANERVRASAAAYGMALVATGLSRKHTRFDEAIEVLNQLALAKATLDMAAYHGSPVPYVTARILQAAQDFVEGETIPGTEWPSTEEIAVVVVNEANPWAWSAQPSGERQK